MACSKCQQSRFGCGGQGCARSSTTRAEAARQKLEAMTGRTFNVYTPRTGGLFDGLAVKAGDAGATRLAKELGMFAILTSPAWLLLLLLPKRQQ